MKFMKFMMSKLKISMLESVEEKNIQTDLNAPLAIARPGARQQLDYWGGCTMQAASISGFCHWGIFHMKTPEEATTRHCKVNAWNPVFIPVELT